MNYYHGSLECWFEETEPGFSTVFHRVVSSNSGICAIKKVKQAIQREIHLHYLETVKRSTIVVTYRKLMFSKYRMSSTNISKHTSLKKCYVRSGHGSSSPATWEVDIGGSRFEVNHGKKKKKLVRPYTKEQLRHDDAYHACNPSYTGGLDKRTVI
jgi:hypothetical protein